MGTAGTGSGDTSDVPCGDLMGPTLPRWQLRPGSVSQVPGALPELWPLGHKADDLVPMGGGCISFSNPG